MLIFVLGCLAGGLGTRVYDAHRATVFLRGGAKSYLDAMEKKVTRRLNLDPGQQAEVHQDFLLNLEGRKRLQAQNQPEIRELNQQTIQQIKAVLRPDQWQVFRENLTKAGRRFGRPDLLPATPSSMPEPTAPSSGTGAE